MALGTQWADGAWQDAGWVAAAWSDAEDPTASLSVSGLSESQIVSGGGVIEITLVGDTWVASGATFDAQRQNIIDGFDSAQSETNGWNAEVRDKEVVGSVVRTSDTVVTFTLTAAAAYDITSSEVITATIPATALVTSSGNLTASPTITVSPAGAGGVAGEHKRIQIRIGMGLN